MDMRIMTTPEEINVSDDRGTVRGVMVTLDYGPGVVFHGTAIPPEGDSLDCWVSGELVGHCVNNRAVVDAIREGLLADDDYEVVVGE